MKNVVRTYSISEEVDKMIEELANTQRRNKSVVIEMAIEDLYKREQSLQSTQEIRQPVLTAVQ